MGKLCVLWSVMAHRVTFAPWSTFICLGNQSALCGGIQCVLETNVFSNLPLLVGKQYLYWSFMVHRVMFATQRTLMCLRSQSEVYVGVQCVVCVEDW